MKLFMPVPCCSFRGMGCFGLLLFAFWLWVLIDCFRNEPRTGHVRLVWLIVIVVGQPIGAALYIFLRRQQRVAMYGR